MEGKEKYVGKRVTVFYNDFGRGVSRKDGICTGYTDSEIELDNRIVLPKSNVVRMEVQSK